MIDTRYAGIELGLINDIRLFILAYVLGLKLGKLPVDVMLKILAVIGCASTLQTADGLSMFRSQSHHFFINAIYSCLHFIFGSG
ncbi:anaerobic C4-dicarboxylate transporter family protein [Xenorhabdus bovienii]|uniref:anaerobic C4-dicarboxylate transporter family protein n=1 Tax=Xenorhabdus bovienii TaxID=40576 RepID=UPI003AFFCE02